MKKNFEIFFHAFSYPHTCVHFFLVINKIERDNICKQTFS
jgi:hypothetical protein